MIATSVVLALGAALTVSAYESSPQYSNPLLAKVMLCTYTDGFRHDSIPTAITEILKWAPYYNMSVDATEDQGKFTIANLAQYDALLFVHTTGNLFSTAGQAAFVDYINKGGNFAAIHAASAGYLDKPWAPWTDTLGATFDHHPKRQNATFVKEMSHPATDPAPDRWVIEEEVYSFTSNPRTRGAKLLWSVDSTSYKDNGTPAAQGDPHPIAWFQDYAAGAKAGGDGPGIPGRSFYSSLGHLNETWQNATFMKHVMGGLTWTFGSNTTRVAAGLYGGAEPTVHTGATNNNSVAAVNPWSPVLGSNATSPPPPPPTTTESASASTPSQTQAGTTGNNTSGATAVRIGSGVWAIALALAGAFAL